MEKAWVDIQRFKEQKDKDLREALINYAVMQISMCKKVHQLAKVERKTGTQVYWMILFLLPNCRESRFGAMPRNVSSRCEAEEISRRSSPSRMILGK